MSPHPPNDLDEIFSLGRIHARSNVVFTPELSASIGASHGRLLGQGSSVVVSREHHNECRMLKRAYIAGLLSAGVNVLNMHVAPVSAVQFAIRRLGVTAGAYFTVWHSTMDIICLRLFDSSGIELSESVVTQTIQETVHARDFDRVAPLRIGGISSIVHATEIYGKALIQMINRDIIWKKRPCVVLDCSYGPAGAVSPELLAGLNVDVVAINTMPQSFTTTVYPNPESVSKVVAITRAARADVGAAFDGDGSRPLLFDENGVLIQPEELMMLILQYDAGMRRHHHTGANVVVSSSVSKILDNFAGGLGLHIVRIQNDPGAISRALREERAIFGAADSYKYYFPQFGPFSDATFTLLKIIEIIAEQNVPLSSLIRSFPRPIRASKSLAREFPIDIKEVFGRVLDPHDFIIQQAIIGIKVVRLTGNPGWVSVMPSFTARSIELTAEAENRQMADDLLKEVEGILETAFPLPHTSRP
jgi:phosphomannomutase